MAAEINGSRAHGRKQRFLLLTRTCVVRALVCAALTRVIT